MALGGKGWLLARRLARTIIWPCRSAPPTGRAPEVLRAYAVGVPALALTGQFFEIKVVVLARPMPIVPSSATSYGPPPPRDGCLNP